MVFVFVAMKIEADSTLQPVDTPFGTPSPKAKQDAGAKLSGYTHTRRPVGGLCRPLPSPGEIYGNIRHDDVNCNCCAPSQMAIYDRMRKKSL